MRRSNILVEEENGREQMMGDGFGVESWNNDLWLSTTIGDWVCNLFLCIHGVLSSEYLVFSDFLSINEYLEVGFIIH